MDCNPSNHNNKNKLSNPIGHKKSKYSSVDFAVYDFCIIWNGFMFSFQSGALEITSFTIRRELQRIWQYETF